MKTPRLINAAVIVAALGYFVDIYDLLLFSIVRIPSLRNIGLEGQDLTDQGIFLLNAQMIGLLAGGVFWGVLGDKKGRLSVLFGSIFLYSIANIANSFVDSVSAYALWRVVAGFGLAGELGAGITLVAEIMPKQKRGYATTIVASVGVSGAVAAYFIAQFFDWRTCYLIGGVLGLLLLLLRVKVGESGLFGKSLAKEVKRGDFLLLITDRQRLMKYIRCIIIGVPLWFVVGILITLSPEFGKVLRVQGNVDAGAAVAACYAGLVIGDIASGLISQYLRSRLKVVLIYLVVSAVAITCFLMMREITLPWFYLVCLLMGASVGYWVIFMTIAAEQFGTNIRATVTTTVPNFVRGMLIPISFLFQYLAGWLKGDIILSAAIVAVLCIGGAFMALYKMQDTFSRDLDFLEEETNTTQPEWVLINKNQ